MHKIIQDKDGNQITGVSGLAWSGVYNDGTLGWRIPSYVSKYPSSLCGEQIDELEEDIDFYRVRITVELVPDSRGNPIVKKHKRKK